MLGTDRVRTLTIHTRKEVIAIFEEVDNIKLSLKIK